MLSHRLDTFFSYPSPATVIEKKNQEKNSGKMIIVFSPWWNGITICGWISDSLTLSMWNETLRPQGPVRYTATRMFTDSSVSSTPPTLWYTSPENQQNPHEHI